MLTLLLLITLTNIKIINGIENNDTKFINSLPEKQKKEFLQKVEKRIQEEVPEVKSPELNETNVELYEKRLEEQGKSIQYILRSEIESLKTYNRRNGNDTDRKQSHIDLTLRAEKEKPEATRRKGEGNGRVINPVSKKNNNQRGVNTNIPVVIQYDSEPVIKTQSKVAKPNEIMLENIIFTTQSVNVNKSRTGLNRSGRRSDYFEPTLKENATIGETNNNTTLNLNSDDFTTTVTTQPTSHDSDIGKIAKYTSGFAVEQSNNNLDTLNITEPTIQGEVTLMTDKVTDNSSTTHFPKFDENDEPFIKTLNLRSGVVVDNIAQHFDNHQTHNELSSSTQLYINSETNKLNTVTDSIMSDKMSTTTNMIDSHNESATENSSTVTNNFDGSTQITNLETLKDVNTTEAGLKNFTQNSDLKLREENSEKQAHYVPVYNYDPENAYYNANSQQPNSNDQNKIIKIKETHSTSTNLDYYNNGNKKSLRIKDVKERIISNNNIEVTMDLHDIIPNSRSAESVNEDIIIEKPLKHTLKKIRTKLYKNSIKHDGKDDVVDKDSMHSENNEDDVTINTNEMQSINTLQNLDDRANNNIKPSSEKETDENISDSETEVFKNIASSLEKHNKVLKNTGIIKIIEAVDVIQNKLRKINHKNNKLRTKKHQSRFRIKDRYGRIKKERTASVETIDIESKEIEAVKSEKSASKVNDDYLELHISIVKDLIERNDVGLEKYDWLGTTVLILGGLEKIREISEHKMRNEKTYYEDEKLLEFIIELYEKAKGITEEQEIEKHGSTRRKKKVSFRIPKPKRGRQINMLNRMYGDLKKGRTLRRSSDGVEDLKEALDCLKTCLFDLHTAIKQVSLITTYKNQRWFKNMKQLYLNPATDKEYLEVLLHLVSARLIRLIDERFKKTPEDDLMKDRAAVERIEVEFVMLMKICDKLMELNG